MSIRNIMLTEIEDDGFLIDLDVAIRIDDLKPSGALSRTGTNVFITIRAFMGDRYNFIHNLNPFFLLNIFLYLYISRSYE